MTIDMTRQGPWRDLFPHALALMDHLATHVKDPPWSFGGGTVLMLRIAHRQSKDIDLFVPDPQYLGYINPRLSAFADELCDAYDESAEHIKLYRSTGEIDVVASTMLTQDPFETVIYEGRQIQVQTNAEIIAKKLWHRGHAATARDLFDLCAVAKRDPASIDIARPFFARSGSQFLARLHDRSALLQRELDAIDTLECRADANECIALAEHIIRPVIA